MQEWSQGKAAVLC